MNKIDLNLLEKVAELRGTPLGAYNIRKNGQGVERHSTENVTIIPKTDKPGNTYTEFSTMDDAKISGKVVYDDIWVGITTSADDEKGTISNESVKMYAKSTKSSTTESK